MMPNGKDPAGWYLKLGMVIVFGAMLGTALLINLVLIPEQEHWLMHGAWVRITFWGLGAQAWGIIQLILAAALLLLFVLNWIISAELHKNIAASAFRKYLFVISAVLFVVFAGLPLFSTPDKAPADKTMPDLPLDRMEMNLNDSVRIRLKQPKPIESADRDVVIEREELPQEKDSTEK